MHNTSALPLIPLPLVSVIVPAFNAAPFLARTLASVSAQTYQPLEILVVNDGSTDETADIVQEKAAQDQRIRLIHQEHSGVAAARNRGVREARGQLIAPLDSDDLWHPEKIERQVRRLSEYPTAGLIYCWSIQIDVEDRIRELPVSRLRFEGDVLGVAICKNIVGNGSTALIKRECIEEAGGFDESLRRMQAEGCEDRKLYMRIAERHDFALVPLFLVGYRVRSGSMSWDFRQMYRSHRLVMSDAQRRWPQLPKRSIRRSFARTQVHLGMRAASLGNWFEALWLCSSALCRDPSVAIEAWSRMRNRRKDLLGQEVHFFDLPLGAADIEGATLPWRRDLHAVKSIRLRTTAPPANRAPAARQSDLAAPQSACRTAVDGEDPSTIGD